MVVIVLSHSVAIGGNGYNSRQALTTFLGI